MTPISFIESALTVNAFENSQKLAEKDEYGDVVL